MDIVVTDRTSGTMIFIDLTQLALKADYFMPTKDPICEIMRAFASAASNKMTKYACFDKLESIGSLSATAGTTRVKAFRAETVSEAQQCEIPTTRIVGGHRSLIRFHNVPKTLTKNAKDSTISKSITIGDKQVPIDTFSQLSFVTLPLSPLFFSSSSAVNQLHKDFRRIFNARDSTAPSSDVKARRLVEGLLESAFAALNFALAKLHAD